MSDLSRHRPYLLWGLGLVGVALLVSLLLVPASSWVSLDQRRSSLRTTPDGLAAWAASLAELGVPTGVRYRSFTDAPPDEPALALMEPIAAPTPEEIHQLLGWVRDGGLLIHSPTVRSGILDSVGVRLTVWGRDDEAGDEVGEVGEVELPGSFADHPWTGGLAAERDSTDWVLAPEPGEVDGWTALTRFPGAGGDLSSLAWAPLGQGGILMLSEAEDVANGSLDSSSVAVATTRAILDLLAPGDTLSFAEYHQGMDGRRSLLRESLAMARASGLGRAFLHAALVGVVALVLAQRGLGAPLPSPSGDRRSPREHVDALARILRSADARASVARQLVRGAARRLRHDPPDPAGRRSTGVRTGPGDGGTALPGPGGPGAGIGNGAGAEAGSDVTELLEGWARTYGEASSAGDPARAALRALRSRPIDLPALSDALDALVDTHGGRRDPTTFTPHQHEHSLPMDETAP